MAPLIAECYANFECELVDDGQVDRYSLFIFEYVKAHVAASPKSPKTVHYCGDGVFMISGENRRYRKKFKPEMLQRSEPVAGRPCQLFLARPRTGAP